MAEASPHIWVLLGARAGDNAQALELARQLGGQVESKQLHFNGLSGLPNLALGSGFKTLRGDCGLAQPWPDIVIATGRRAAPVSLAIKEASGGRTLSVHIGRPRMALDRFDLILSTPQYGLPRVENVVPLVFPFARAKTVSPELKVQFEEMWAQLPRPWIAGVIGAGKFPMRLGDTELVGFADGLNSLATRLGGSILLMDSPRSRTGAIRKVADHLDGPHWLWTRGVGDNPYQAALALTDQFAVTSDSVSMVSEMVQTGRPVHVYHLPVSGGVPRWSAQDGLAARLSQKGILSPPRDVRAYLSVLLDKGWIGDLGRGLSPPKHYQPSAEHPAAVKRIIALWRSRVTG